MTNYKPQMTTIRIEDALNSVIQCHQEGKAELAEHIFNRILKAFPDNADVLHLLGSVAYRMGKHETAIDLIYKAIQNDPVKDYFYSNLASFFKSLNRLEDAAAMYRSAISINPDYAEAHNNLGIILKMQEKWEEAAACYYQAIAIAPDYAQAHNNLGIVLNAMGKPDKAVESFQRAITKAPDMTEAHHNLANTLTEQHKWHKAVTAYRRAIAINPNIAEIHNGLGIALRYLSKLEQAAAAFQQAVTVNPDYAEAYNNLGNTLVLLEKADEAVTAYRRAIAVKPDYVNPYYNLCLALKGQGKTDEAIDVLRRIIELEPASFSAKHTLAALTGQTTEIAPKEYVKALFDQYSGKFDHHLVDILEYKTPKLLREALDYLWGDKAGNFCFQNLIDLGCGTGLAGLAFRSAAHRLVGIDISPKMIDQAKEKNIYDVLHVGDITEFMTHTSEKYDGFIAADVFVYIGNLKPVFDAVCKRAMHSAYFVFSIEISHESSNYMLQETGRYSHSRQYIQSLSDTYGFIIKASCPAILRKEKKERVRGEIFVLKKCNS